MRTLIPLSGLLLLSLAHSLQAAPATPPVALPPGVGPSAASGTVAKPAPTPAAKSPASKPAATPNSKTAATPAPKAAAPVPSPAPVAASPVTAQPVAAQPPAPPPDAVAQTAHSVNPFTGKALSLDELTAAAQAERLRSQVIDEKVKQAEQLAKIECYKDPRSRYCAGNAGAAAFLDAPMPPLKTAASKPLEPVASPADTRKKTASRKKTATPVAMMPAAMPAAPIGPRVLGIAQQNGHPAALVDLGGQVHTVPSGGSIGGRQIGRIQGCRVELGGQSIEVCGRIGETAVTDAPRASAKSPLLPASRQGGGDGFLAPPAMPQPASSQPLVPQELGAPPLVINRQS
ncbi:hypothetical protein BUE93_20410 [Chromobacterium amazonense]|uniref:Type IV pilus biogenesis protein PilP n=1 Tax=Chromobacterium amazonense TaxID=1382803 RepID=A0A2S9WZB5_9NEIS|nr:hypothetical protein [Chromobacterium amazonense]PRP68812.1 hypothetical protein BUE93_20410 [Chromobacterium amazonense]